MHLPGSDVLSSASPRQWKYFRINIASVLSRSAVTLQNVASLEISLLVTAKSVHVMPPSPPSPAPSPSSSLSPPSAPSSSSPASPLSTPDSPSSPSSTPPSTLPKAYLKSLSSMDHWRMGGGLQVFGGFDFVPTFEIFHFADMLPQQNHIIRIVPLSEHFRADDVLIGVFNSHYSKEVEFEISYSTTIHPSSGSTPSPSPAPAPEPGADPKHPEEGSGESPKNPDQGSGTGADKSGGDSQEGGQGDKGGEDPDEDDRGDRDGDGEGDGDEEDEDEGGGGGDDSSQDDDQEDDDDEGDDEDDDSMTIEPGEGVVDSRVPVSNRKSKHASKFGSRAPLSVFILLGVVCSSLLLFAGISFWRRKQRTNISSTSPLSLNDDEGREENRGLLAADTDMGSPNVRNQV
eukprot:GILI01007693.1.p1 GENE.GILI01007693.1~~GILI01007693.1.p1  ORF type:complete len:402 (-),score=98.06 GILI01007693.1:297-1502(-)